MMLSVEGLQISDSVILNMECVQSLTAAIDPAAVHAACTTTRHPLKFANQAHEMSFMGLWRLLDFETLADQQFVKSGRVSAKEMAQDGLVNLLMSGCKLDSASLTDLSREHIIKLFEIESVFRAHGEDTSTESDAVDHYAILLQHLLRSTGEALEAQDMPSLGDFIMNSLNDSSFKSSAVMAQQLVNDLANTFPGYMDIHVKNGRRIILMRNAQALVADLFLRFRSESPIFNFKDINSIGPDSGWTAIAYLRMKGCIDCSSSISEAVALNKLSSQQEELALRHCCDVALRLIAAELQLGPWQVGRWVTNACTQSLHQEHSPGTAPGIGY